MIIVIISQVSSTRSLDIHLHRMSAAFTCFSRFAHYLTFSNSYYYATYYCNDSLFMMMTVDIVYSTGSKYRQDVCAWQNQKHLKWAKSWNKSPQKVLVIIPQKCNMLCWHSFYWYSFSITCHKHHLCMLRASNPIVNDSLKSEKETNCKLLSQKIETGCTQKISKLKYVPNMTHIRQFTEYCHTLNIIIVITAFRPWL